MWRSSTYISKILNRGYCFSAKRKVLATSKDHYITEAILEDYDELINEVSRGVYQGTDYLPGLLKMNIKQHEKFPNIKHNLITRLKDTDEAVAFHSFTLHGYGENVKPEEAFIVGSSGRIHPDFAGAGLFGPINSLVFKAVSQEFPTVSAKFQSGLLFT